MMHPPRKMEAISAEQRFQSLALPAACAREALGVGADSSSRGRRDGVHPVVVAGAIEEFGPIPAA